MHARIKTPALFALALALAWAPGAVAANESLERAVAGALAKLPKRAEIGVRFEEAGGKLLYERGSAQALVPASNMKLLTTSTALALLGPDFAHETRLVLAGGRQSGEVHQGDLWLIGGGDPTFSFRFDQAPLLDELALQLERAGIKRIEGALVVDARAFDEERLHPSWEASDAEHWYGAEVSALTLNDNCLDVTVSAGPRASLAPETDYVRVLLEATSTGARKQHTYSLLRSGPDKRTLILRGRIWTGAGGQTSSVPVADPAAFYATVLAERLAAHGVTLTKGVRRVAPQEPAPAQGFTLWRRLAPLPRTLAVVNQRSHNLYAECLFKTLGRLDVSKTPPTLTRQGSWTHGAEVVTLYAKARLGIAPDELVVSDGSGLSRDNRLSSRALCRVIQGGLSNQGAEHFFASLAQPGEDGTLRKRLGGLPAQVTVHAKTGTLTGVSALSGVLCVGERRVVFSLVMNGPGTSRRYLDEILSAAAGALR